MTTYLIVDDSPTIRLTIERILRTVDPENPQILYAPSGAEAIQMFEQSAVDIVFLDINLGDGNGNDVLRDILRRDPGAKVIIASSSSRRDARVEDAMSQGAMGFLEKPLRREQLSTLLEDIEREYRPTRRIR